MNWKRILFLTHRWIGIGMCLLFALWFASGIVMMYVDYPELTYTESVAAHPDLQRDRVALTPFEAARQAGEITDWQSASLAMLADRPVYRLRATDGRSATIFADTGERMERLGEQGALAVAAASGLRSGAAEPEHLGLIEVDQWTITGSLNPSRPLHKVALNDSAGTVLYISERDGRVVRDTTGRERFWNWPGSTVHWIYPLAIRQFSGFWLQLIIWLSMIGLVSVVTGTVIGLLQLRPFARNGDRGASPYTGVMKWHHIGGLCCVVIIAAFLFSGLMSVSPWGVFAPATSPLPQIAGYQGQLSLRLSDFSVPAPAGEPVREVNWLYLGGQPYSVSTLASGARLPDFGPDQQPDVAARISGAVPQLLPGSSLTSFELLEAYDDYYYSRHFMRQPLPAYRARFDDAEETWYHINATTGEVVNRLTRRGRLERWLFNGLHSLDFQFLRDSRPLWDLTVILLSLAGLGFSITSIVIGWRRLTR
ncbi:MAG: PepSY domain-containing protein [Gammaproteobacteria bacterium]|nr:PepSY domain-containing protein [Gammaproteobacteria bacterium]